MTTNPTQAEEMCRQTNAPVVGFTLKPNQAFSIFPFCFVDLWGRTDKKITSEMKHTSFEFTNIVKLYLNYLLRFVKDYGSGVVVL